MSNSNTTYVSQVEVISGGSIIVKIAIGRVIMKFLKTGGFGKIEDIVSS